MVQKKGIAVKAIVVALLQVIMLVGTVYSAKAPTISTPPLRVAVLPVVDLVEGNRTGESLTMQLTALLLQRFQTDGYQMIDDQQLQNVLAKHNFFTVAQKKEKRQELLTNMLQDLHADAIVMLALDDYGTKEPLIKGQNDLIVAYLKMDNTAIFTSGKVIRETPTIERTYEYLWNRNGLEAKLAMKAAKDFLHKVDMEAKR